MLEHSSHCLYEREDLSGLFRGSLEEGYFLSVRRMRWILFLTLTGNIIFRSIPQTSKHYIHTFVSFNSTFQSSGQETILQKSLFTCRFSKEAGRINHPLIRVCTHSPRNISMNGCLRVHFADLACFPNSRLYSFSLSASSLGPKSEFFAWYSGLSRCFSENHHFQLLGGCHC